MFLFLLVILFFGSCGPDTPPVIRGEEVLDFPSQLHTWSIRNEDGGLPDAAKEWNEDTGVELFVADEQEPNIEVMVGEKKVPDGNNAYSYFGNDYCHIYFRSSSLMENKNLFMHELGHCLGFGHSSNSNAIMAHHIISNMQITLDEIEIIRDNFYIEINTKL